jgi:hypothetical protein
MIAGILLLVLVLVTYCVASEGAWGAGLTFLCVLFAALLAMNLFEPAAELLEGALGLSWRYRVDFVALVGLFTALTFGLRLATERLAPTFIETDGVTHEVGRWGLGLATGYLTMAFLLTALHTAPLPRTVTAAGVDEFLGFEAEKGNFLGLYPDRQWLGFVQHVSRKGLNRGEAYVFDGPEYTVGEHEGRVWPSFPLRYASRREELGSVPVAASGAAGGGPASGTERIEPPKTTAPSNSSGGF